MTEEAQRLIKTIKQMQDSMDDSKTGTRFKNDDTQVTYPLTRCLKALKEKYNSVAKQYQERFEQIRSQYIFPKQCDRADQVQKLPRLSNRMHPTSSPTSSRLSFHRPHQMPLSRPRSISPTHTSPSWTESSAAYTKNTQSV